jgi:ectoine hydroxylase-related dioxygenase (phytanoyl-CoA dioxygenase family)
MHRERTTVTVVCGGKQRTEYHESRQSESPETQVASERAQSPGGTLGEDQDDVAGDGERRCRKECEEVDHGAALIERSMRILPRRRPWLSYAQRPMRGQERFHTTQAQVDAFQADGAVVLRRLLEPAEVELLRRGIDANLAHPSPRAKVASSRDDPGYFLEDFCCWQENPCYRQFIFESQLGEVGARLMQSAVTRLYHDHMLTKEPGTRARTPWHQDQPYYNISGRQNCSFWIPVDPVSRDATLEFVAGSHHGPWLMPRSFMEHEAKWFPEGSLADLPDIEADRGRYRILAWELEPGDAVCFHMLTLHASAGAGTRRRRVFSVRLLGDDILHAPRRWQTSPDFPQLLQALAAGAPMEHPLFPVLWPK